MPVKMIELEEVMMLEVSDTALESVVGRATVYFVYPTACGTDCNVTHDCN